jgi:cell division protein FtsA
VDIEDLVLGVLAASEGCLSKRQKELGVALVNLGASTTSLVVFEEGDVLHTKILPIGAAHITNDIAIGLRTSIDLAEKIKLEYGSAQSGEINKRDEINLSELEGGENTIISKKQVAEIIEARVEEIFKMLDKELQKVDRSGLLPAGIVITGGGAKLPGLIEVAKKEFRLPASIGYPQNFVSAIDKVNDPAFSTALGLIFWGLGLKEKGGFSLSMPKFSSVADATKKMKGWFKSLIP